MADDISKLCSDYLRQAFPGLKASHARELVAAFFGYKSHAALLSEDKYKVDDIAEAAVLVPAIPLIDHRRTCLDRLSGIASGTEVAEQLVAFLREKQLFGGQAWTCPDIGNFMIEEYLPEKLSGELDSYLAEPIAETNAYFEDHEYKRAELEETSDLLTIKVEGTFYGEMDSDGDRMFAGDTIDFVAIVQLYRVAGRIGFMEPKMDAAGSVRRDYYDDGPEDELTMRITPPNVEERSTDIDVAKYVMGWTHFSEGECLAHPEHSHWERNGQEGNIPAYSTDLDAARDVVNHLAKQGLVFSEIKAGVSFHKELISYEVINCETALAICEAALLAARIIDPKSSTFGRHLIRTWNDDHDGYSTYRIKHYCNGDLVDWVSAGELEHRLRFALEHWHLTPELRNTIRTWLNTYSHPRRPGGGSRGQDRSRTQSRRTR